MSGFLIMTDSTFNTNTHRLPLLVAVDKLGSGRTFPIASSWAPCEDKESYCFFWTYLKEHCFERPGEPHAAPPAVILGDQSGGFTASISLEFPQAQQQFCTWHAVQAIAKKLRDCGFKKSDLDGAKDEGQERIIGLRERCWNYIKAPT